MLSHSALPLVIHSDLSSSSALHTHFLLPQIHSIHPLLALIHIMPLYICHIRLHESVSRSMACSVLPTDPLEPTDPFLTFPAPDFAVILDSTQEHTSTDRASKTLNSSGDTSDARTYVPGALFSNAPMSFYNDLNSATTMFNFLPVSWSKKEHYSAAVTGLQQLVLPSPAAHFTSLTKPSAPSSSSSKLSPSRSPSWSKYADSQECSCPSDEIAMGVSEYIDYLNGSGWNVPSSTIARLAVSLHNAALARHAYLLCMGNYNDYNENNDDDVSDGDNDDDDIDRDRDRDRDSESRSWKRISSYGGPSMFSRSKRKLLHNKNKNKNKNMSQKLLSELSRSFYSILRAHLEDCRPLGTVFLFLTGVSSEEQNINGFKLSNYNTSMESSALELKLLHRGSCDDDERSGRKRRNSDQSIHSSGSARGYPASGAGDDDDDMSEAELLFILSNRKDRNRNRSRNESAHKRQKEQVKGELGQGLQVALENGEEEVDEEKNDTHPALSLHGVLGSLDEELNAADRLKHTLESVLSSAGINSSDNLRSPLLRRARELSMNSKFPPKPIDDVELFLSKCREEKSKFQNLSKLASSIIYPNVMQE